MFHLGGSPVHARAREPVIQELTYEECKMKLLRVFIASPGDVKEERDVVSMVVEELSRSIGDILDVQLQTIRWETHAWPDVGEDAQDVINKEIGDYDIFVGVMWKRFGTPTKRASSGTGEEFQRALRYFQSYQRPKIMFYFRKQDFYSEDLKELGQFKSVIQFKKTLAKSGILYWEYRETIEFERRFREHLTRQIHRLTQVPKPPPTEKPPAKIFISYAREDLAQVEILYNSLKVAGFEPWLDVKDILPGQNWKQALSETITKSDYFLACLSEKALDKRGFVHTELNMALDMLSKLPASKTYIIPARLSAVQLPEELFGFQWVDIFGTNDIEKLVNALKEMWKNNNNTQLLTTPLHPASG